MSFTGPFYSDRKYYALDLYPYGIGRSGDFTLAQTLFLEDHGWAYLELDQGVRPPAHQEEMDFLSVCRGEKKPETEHEIAWHRFRDKSGPARKVLSSVSSVQGVSVEDLGGSSIHLHN